MTGTVLTTFAAFSTDSGASKEVVGLMKIKENLTASRTKVAPAPGGTPAATPGFTISGDNAVDAVLRGVAHLDKELRDREAAIEVSTESAEGLIQKVMEKLNRLAHQITVLHESLKKKEADRQAECSHQRQVNSEKGQQLVAKEAELAKREKALEDQKLR